MSDCPNCGGLGLVRRCPYADWCRSRDGFRDLCIRCEQQCGCIEPFEPRKIGPRAIAIIADWKAGTRKQRDLARKHGCSTSRVAQILVKACLIGNNGLEVPAGLDRASARTIRGRPRPDGS